MTEQTHQNRKSPRLPDYDYSQAGVYFVTICTAQREHLFGEIRDSEVIHSPMGKIAVQCWQDIPQHFPTIEIDLFVVMPNHVHGLVVINENSVPSVGTRYISSSSPKLRANGVKPQSLGAIVGSYKAAVTRQIRHILTETSSHIWQGRYHDHIIRNEQGLNQLREYILNNPARWSEDVFYSS